MNYSWQCKVSFYSDTNRANNPPGTFETSQVWKKQKRIRWETRVKICRVSKRFIVVLNHMWHVRRHSAVCLCHHDSTISVCGLWRAEWWEDVQTKCVKETVSLKHNNNVFVEKKRMFGSVTFPLLYFFSDAARPDKTFPHRTNRARTNTASFLEW